MERPQTTLVPREGPQRAGPVVQPHGAMLASDQLFNAASVPNPLLEDAVSLGTTIIAVAFKGGVMLAADSRTSTGTYVVNRVTNKLTKLTNNVYCCRSGSAADTQAMAEVASRYLRELEVDTGRPVPVASAASLLQRLCYVNRWNIQAGIIVAGYDEINGGTVYNIPLGGSCIKHGYAMGGSGSVFLYGWMDAKYKPDMSKDECLQFVREAVAHALSRDGSSGGVVRTMCIDSTGTEHTTLPWTAIPYCMEKDPSYAKLARLNQPFTSSSKEVDNETETH